MSGTVKGLWQLQILRRVLRVLSGLAVGSTVTGLCAAGTATYTYDANGRPTGITYDNGITITYQMDANGNRTGVTVTGLTPPTPPASETDSNITGTSATVSWTAATAPLGVTGYRYQVNGGTWSAFSSSLSDNLTGLAPGTTYTVEVEAEDAAGDVGTPSTITFTTGPSAPGIPTASGITGNSATVSWTAATDPNGVAGYSYQLNGGTWSAFSNVLSVPLTGLSYGMAYTVNVRAEDPAGNIGSIATGSFTTGPTAPGTPTASGVTGTSATVSWTASSDSFGVTGYSYQVNGGAWSAYSNVLSVSLTGLNYGATYTVGVRAQDNPGNISATATGSFTTLPSAPGTPTASSITGTSATVSWTAATDQNGVSSYSYQLNGGAWTSVGNAGSVNLTSLSYGTTLTVCVRAQDAAGNIGPPSCNTFTTPPSTPGVPTTSNITGITATVAWTAATGSVGYRYSINGGTSWTTVGNVFSVSLSGLAFGTTYTVLVEAENSAGSWGASSSASFTTAPSAPGAPTASNIGPTSAKITWTAATGSVGGYRYSVNGGTSWTTVGNVLTATVSGLALGTAYTVLIEAENPAGTWGTSSSGSFTTLSFYTDTFALSGGATVNVYDEEAGYSQVPMLGALTPDTTSNGKSIYGFYYLLVNSTHASYSTLQVQGFTSNPGAGWLQSVSGGTVLTGATATFSYGSGLAVWTWTNSTGAAIGTNVALTIVHQ